MILKYKSGLLTCLTLLGLFSGVYGKGIMEVIIQPELNATLIMKLCWETWVPCYAQDFEEFNMTLVAGKQIVQQKYTEDVFRRHFELIANATDLVTNETIGELAMFHPISRSFSNLTLKTKQGPVIRIGVRKICLQHWYGDECRIPCNPSTPQFQCTERGEECAPGWKGPSCRTAICDTKCENGGWCARPGECRCGRGFGGLRCETCIPMQGCKGGRCAVHENGTEIAFTCDCYEGFAGYYCDIVDICAIARPCRNGRCVLDQAYTSGFRCYCKYGWLGVRCDEIDYYAEIPGCPPGYCKNKGACFVRYGDTQPSCKCQPGTRGDLCEEIFVPDCETTECDEDQKCVMDKGKPICVLRENPEPFVSVKRNNGTSTFNVYFGCFRWEFPNISMIDDPKLIENAHDESLVNVYYLESSVKKSDSKKRRNKKQKVTATEATNTTLAEEISEKNKEEDD